MKSPPKFPAPFTFSFVRGFARTYIQDMQTDKTDQSHNIRNSSIFLDRTTWFIIL